MSIGTKLFSISTLALGVLALTLASNALKAEEDNSGGCGCSGGGTTVATEQAAENHATHAAHKDHGSAQQGHAAPAAHQAHGAGHAAPAAAAAQAAGDPYLLATDPVTGDKLGKDAVTLQHEGRELRFATQANADKFKANPKQYLPKVDEALVKQQLPFYPSNTCAVSNEKLGGMGETINYIHGNRLVRFCCESCIGDFKKDPDKFLKKLDAAAIAAQKAKYPLTTCAVGGGKLGEMGEPVDVVIGNRLVRLCCNGCQGKLQKDPVTYLSKINAAKAE